MLRALRSIPGVVDAVVTEEHALVTFVREALPDPEALEAALDARQSGETLLAREHSIRVAYTGPDLDDVARLTGLTRAEVVEAHGAPTYTVAFLGFQPGFAYLRGLDPRLVLPRRSTPRPRVAAGSLAIAGPYAGIYPFDSPGGWHLLGVAVGFTPFDPTTGATLGAGDRVRFIAVAP